MATNPLIDDRVEATLSPTGGDPVTRMAHFLKPAIGASASPSFKLPSLTQKCSWPVFAEYNGWRDPQKNWTGWVDRMEARHQAVWRKVGVYSAIQCSKYSFERNDDLIKNFAERWSSDSNTFVFPWGEATLTLEDLDVLGGLPVTGNCAFVPLSGEDLRDSEHMLKRFPKSRRNHQTWLEHYMGKDSIFEHVAFLCLWVSRFVLPGNEVDQIGEHVFPVAVSLSRGVKVALAPAVLANIYRDLGILSSSMTAAYGIREAEVRDQALAWRQGRKQEEGPMSVLAVGLWSPLQFVQLWIWERFVVFRPEPRFLKSGDMRAARWDGLGRSEVGNVRPILDTCGEVFIWRPYCLKLDEWLCPRFHKKEEGSSLLRKSGKFLDEELESHARCLRSCVLVGTDGNEPYQPHRVAMQFGLDQDIPAMIPRTSESAADAWEEYTRPFGRDFSLYLPARLFDGDVSVRYRKWWIQSVVVLGSFPAVVKGQRFTTVRCFEDHSREAKLACVICCRLHPSFSLAPPAPVPDVPPGFPRKNLEDPPIPACMFKDAGNVRPKKITRITNP